MTLSNELFPAPFGPMIARISCSRTSKLTSASAFTPPKASETPSSARITSPTGRATRPGSSSRRFMRRRLRTVHAVRSSSCRRPGSVQGRIPGGAPAPPSRRLLRRGRREGLHIDDRQLRADRAGAAILETHLRLHRAARGGAIERLDDARILLRDEPAPDLARARELAVVGVELLVQDHEAVDLAPGELRIPREVGVHLLDAAADEVDHL